MAQRSSRHRTVAIDVDEVPPSPPKPLPVPWYVIAGAGALLTLLSGWVLMAAMTGAGWVTSNEAPWRQASGLATDVLVLAHGVPVAIGEQRVSLIPLTLTLVLVIVGRALAAFATRQLVRARGQADVDTGGLWVDPRPLLARIVGCFAGVQGVAAALLANAVAGSPGRGLLGGLAIGGIASLWGAASVLGWDPRTAWPTWARSIPSAIAAACAVCVAGGSTVFAAALIRNRGTFLTIHDGLAAGGVGGALLLLAQLLFLPNLLLWGAAWVLGAGVTLGDGSLVSAAVTDVGFLPSIPVLGALPPAGAAPRSLLLWLLVGVAAGAVAALIVALARPRARFDETGLVGGLAGVVAGFVIALLAGLASGGLGAGRLSLMGVRLTDALVVAPSLLGLSGLLAGVILGLVRRPRRDQVDGSELSGAGATSAGPAPRPWRRWFGRS